MRLIGLDIARFLAFAGMVYVNFRVVSKLEENVDFANQFTHAVEGRAAALFVVLAGVGIALASPTPSVIVKRGLFLFALGMINLTIFEADILHYYGVYFLCIIPFLRASSGKLLTAAAAITLVAYVGLFVLGYDAEWDWETLEYQRFWTLSGFIRNLFYNGWHPVFPWLAFVLVGMSVGRLNLFDIKIQFRMLLGGIAIAIVTNLASKGLGGIDPELAEIVSLSPIPPNSFYIVSASGTAVAAIGATLILTPILKKIGLGEALAATGRQALTLYLAHILIGMGGLEMLGWINGEATSKQIFNYSTGFIVLTIIYALLWQRFAKRGPFEQLFRNFTQGRS